MNDKEIEQLSIEIGKAVFRTNLDNPGYFVLKLSEKYPSNEFRKLMLQIICNIERFYYLQSGKHLIYIAIGCYDQQESTKFHLDGGPEESFLLLGYEPTDVEYKVEIADYCKAANNLAITAKQYVEEYNPIFKSNEQTLLPYSFDLMLDKNYYNLVVLNNSCSNSLNGQLGILHKATIKEKLKNKSRIIYSIQIGFSNGISVCEDAYHKEKFLTSAIVSKKPYE